MEAIRYNNNRKRENVFTLFSLRISNILRNMTHIFTCITIENDKQIVRAVFRTRHVHA